MSVARRPVDSDAGLAQLVTERIDIIDCIGQMAEVAAAVVGFRIPVMGQFQQRVLVFWCCQEYQREAACRIVLASHFPQTQLCTVKLERSVKIGDANHGVEVFHYGAPLGMLLGWSSGNDSTDTMQQDRRISLIRQALVFQLKLFADGLRDVLLVPFSLGAALMGLLRSADDPEREFEQVLDLGRRAERWINLFGTHDVTAGETDGAASMDELVSRAERVVHQQMQDGGVSEKAAAALKRALDHLDRSARGEQADQDKQKDPET